jgi:putative 4-mercaptohistidine N1-methyltranferase
MPALQGASSSAGGKHFHFTFITSPATQYRHAKNLAIFLAGAVTALAYTAYRRRKALRKLFTQPDLANAGSGAEILETRAAVDRLLLTHYGRPQDALPDLFLNSSDSTSTTATTTTTNILNLALEYPSKLALLCERHCAALCDFTGEYGDATALDIGCGVGATTFELSRAFLRVIGLDSTKTYINAAKTLKERGWMRYTSVTEGELTSEHSSVVADDIERDRVNFAVVEDVSSIPRDFTGPHDAVLAANLLCRVHDPLKFIAQLPKLVRPGGIAVLSSPYDWKESSTCRNNWLGGFKGRDGEEVFSVDTLKTAMKGDFELITQEELPFLVGKEHDRRYEVGLAQATVWKRK